ncbi:uncharacterized protein LOC111380697 [Olea europaea var. sylvestris]|uniref:uncharacterized protein LOC111380697 n=1 Tax=Olea europaea var. sylvestris TaxID=158386 RepID=UPI000C1D3C65|nr:uncharacterized protein LOC111380697 [Olea europaea var. sylvestris]
MESEYVSGSNELVKKNSEVKHEDGIQLLEAKTSGFSSVSSSSSLSNEHLKKNSEVKHEDGKQLLEAKASGFSSVSSSSSVSSLELNTGERVHFDDPSLKSGQDGPLSFESEFLSSLDVTDQIPNWSMISASPHAEAGFLSSPGTSYQSPEWNTDNKFQMQSPPVQTMGQPAGYDPNRIPSSIFSPKPTSAMEWSVTSNESLFSIGSNSYSRDQANLLGKSGELPRREESNNSPLNLQYVPDAKSDDFNSFPSVLPPVLGVPQHEENSVKLGKSSSVIEEDCSNSLEMAPVTTVENHAKENIAPVKEIPPPDISSNAVDGKGIAAEATRTSSGAPLTSPSLPRLSDESGNSCHSFAFPVLVNIGEKTDSCKVINEKPQLESQLPEANPKASETRWFSSSSCWPCCC